MKPWQKLFHKKKPLSQQELETWVQLAVEPEEVLRAFQKAMDKLGERE